MLRQQRRKDSYRLPFAVDLASILPYDVGEELQIHADFRAVFYENTRSRRVLQAILDYALVFQRSHVVGDSHETAHREGMRDVGLWLMEMIDQPIETYSEKRQSEIENVPEE